MHFAIFQHWMGKGGFDTFVLVAMIEIRNICVCFNWMSYVSRLMACRRTSTGTHSSSVRVGQMWWGSVIVVLSGLRMTLVRSAFTCKARRMRIRREKAVYDEMVFNQSSYRLNNTICGSVAFKIMSPSFSTCKGQKQKVRELIFDLLQCRTVLLSVQWLQNAYTFSRKVVGV